MIMLHRAWTTMSTVGSATFGGIVMFAKLEMLVLLGDGFSTGRVDLWEGYGGRYGREANLGAEIESGRLKYERWGVTHSHDQDRQPVFIVKFQLTSLLRVSKGNLPAKLGVESPQQQSHREQKARISHVIADTFQGPA